MGSLQCSICEKEMQLKHRLRFNVYQCSSCGLLSSDASFDHSFSSYEDEETRATGLKDLRLTNFQMILDAFKQLRPVDLQTLKGLEVGCGPGWWLEMCKANNITCKGIEPEETFKEYHHRHQLDVAYGFYPQVSNGSNEQFDFIIFNDVFEHIPAINELTLSLKRDMKNDGLLIINIPMSNGFFYRMATLLNTFGIRSFLERMWQFNFHSPHMNYFNEKNLVAFMLKHELHCIKDFKLNTLDFTSLKERVITDNSIGKFKAFFITRSLALLKPLITSSKPDIRVFFFQKKNR